MGLREATNAAQAIRASVSKNPHCIVAYQFTRGCYAVIVTRDDSPVVLVDDDAVRLYRMRYGSGEGGVAHGA